jgi:hypothetical protein
MKKDDDRVGVGTVAEMIGLTKQTIYVMRSNGKLPEPDAQCECDRHEDLWKVSTILDWDATRRTR